MALAFGMGSVEWGPWDSTSWVCLFLLALIYGVYSYELRQASSQAKKVEAVGEKDKLGFEKPLIEADRSATYGSVVLGVSCDADAVVEAGRVATLCGWMVLCSAAIIYTNAWILDNMCPHAATLTAIQQGVGACLAFVCVFGFKAAEPVEGMTFRMYATYILPLSACFTIYLWGSNAAYIYLAPGFVQMVKPLGSALVFVVATALGLETYSHYKFGNFLLICAGIAVTAYSRFDGVGSNMTRVAVGLTVLVTAYTVVAFYNTGLQILQKKGLIAAKFNPLTTLLYIAPATCVSMLALAGATEWSKPDFQCFDKLPLWLLALDCGIAFVFNLSMMLFIGKLSAVAYSVFAFFKEIVLVIVAFFFFREAVTRSEIEGYVVTLVAVLVWQHRKLTGRGA